MNWWKAHHGLPYDNKFGILAKRLNARRTDVAMVWISCLDYASQQEERGSIHGLDVSEIAFGLDLDTQEVTRILEGFRERGMIEEEYLSAWDKRQETKRDRTAAERKRRQREREKTDVTPGHARDTVTVTHGHERDPLVCVSSSLLSSSPKKEESSEKQTVAQMRSEFAEWIEPWPRVSNPNAAAMAWVDRVNTPEDAARAFSSRDTYLASDEVKRNVIMDPARFIYEQAKCGWTGKWPAAKRESDDRRRGLLEIPKAPPKPTQAQEIEAMRDLLASPEEPEDMKVFWRQKLTEMGVSA